MAFALLDEVLQTSQELLSHGEHLWCSCQSEQVTHLLTSTDSNEPVLIRCQRSAEAARRHSWRMGARRDLPWSTTSCLRQKVLWCWAHGILQHALIPLNTQCIMQRSVFKGFVSRTGIHASYIPEGKLCISLPWVHTFVFLVAGFLGSGLQDQKSRECVESV